MKKINIRGEREYIDDFLNKYASGSIPAKKSHVSVWELKKIIGVSFSLQANTPILEIVQKNYEKIDGKVYKRVNLQKFLTDYVKYLKS